MKGDTALDYAVFQLDEAQTRCELWICAGEKNEKLASGSLKPFVAHLRAAKEQLAKGSNFIIMQAPPFVGDGSPWFTKRTVERFVRFVSTPDVLESVSVLEAELAKLDDATSILISDSSWSCDPLLKSAPVTPRTGSFSLSKSQAENSADQQGKTYTRRPSFDYAGVALLDGSKRDLLKAMETRRLMLLHEQKKAFAHATAAGFNVSCISDLMVFANCFGSPRLWETCLKFMTLCKKKQDSTLDELYMDSALSSSTDTGIQIMSHNSGTSESSEAGSVNSKAKARKTWDPQVMSTLQQLHSRKVENGSLMSPDGKKIIRKQKTLEPILLGDEDLVVGARESVSLFQEPYIKLLGNEFRSKVDDKTITVQEAISLFESKQIKVEDSSKKKTPNDTCDSEKLPEPAKPVIPESIAEEITEGTKVVIEVASAAQNISEEPAGKPSALAVVSEATELEELDGIQWQPLSKSSGYIFDDMFLDQKSTVSQSNRRQSLCVWRTAWDNESEPGIQRATGPKGRFYDQYQEIREAKLKHEPTVKKAEKEAKMKAMQDVLEKRKAELSTKSMRLSDASAVRSNSSRKDVQSKSCELSKFGSKRSSPVTSAHSTQQASKQDSSHPRTVRKPSPSSQRSSTATTPRASLASCESKVPINRMQRRSAESLYPEQGGKENVDPMYTSDIEVPQPFKFLERKSKGSLVMTKRSGGSTGTDNSHSRREPQSEQSKVSKAENTTIHKRGIQTRQLSASSAVKGQSLKLQKTKSDVSTSSLSSDILLPLKLDNDDSESSCSCPTADIMEDTCTTSQQADSAEDLKLDVTLLQVEDENGVVKVLDKEECVEDLSANKDEGLKKSGDDLVVAEGSDIKQLNTQGVQEQAENTREPELNVAEDAKNEAEADGDQAVASKDIARDSFSFTGGDCGSMKRGATDIEASIDLDILIEELAKDELCQAEATERNSATTDHPATKTTTTATPLFELAELDQKKFPAAYKVHPPLEDLSSSSIGGTSSTISSCIDCSAQPGVESFGSSKGDEEAETTCFRNDSGDSSLALVGSFIPGTIAAAAAAAGAQAQAQKCTIFPGILTRKSSSDSATRASSEPGSPSSSRPLFDLLVTENNAHSNTNSSSKALKSSSSSSHKLPHMCRLPSPDARGAAAVVESSIQKNKKLLLQKSSTPASASAPKLKEPLKGFRKFLRFGRRSCGANSEQQQRIMWQNGWFKGE